MGKTNFFDFRESLLHSRPRDPAAAAPTVGKPAAPAGAPSYTVSQLTALIDGALRNALPPTVLVKGEISNFKGRGASGHMYFTLKDPTACLDCVMFKTEAARLKFDVTDGLAMLAEGRIGVYPQRGRYQLYVDRLQPLGKGALELAFRQLRA